MTGNVKWFDDRKGFGFLLGDDGRDYFVHYREVKMEGRITLYEGQKVSFDPTTNKKGLCAENVEIMAEPIKQQ